MAEGPLVLRDLSACYDDCRRGAPARVRAMRMLIGHADPEQARAGRVAASPETFAGGLVAAKCGL